MSRRILTGAAIASFIAVAAACSPAPSSTSSTGASSPESTAASVAASPSSPASGPGALLFGTYTATIPEGVNASPGTWTLTVSASDLLFTRPDGQSFSPGALQELTASEIVLAADPACPTQTGTPTEGRYGWMREGDALTFELVSDSCQDRIDTLTSSDWSVQP